jgi:hypothetical protein
MKEKSSDHRTRHRLPGTRSLFANASPETIVKLMEHPLFIERHRVLKIGDSDRTAEEFHQAANEAHEITKALVKEGWPTDVLGAADLVQIGQLRKPHVSFKNKKTIMQE